VADSEEDRADVHLETFGVGIIEPFGGMAFGVADERRARDALLGRSADLGEFGVANDFDLAGRDVLFEPVDPVVLRPERLAAVDQIYLGGELREKGCLLHRGIAAADNDHLLVAEEGPIAGRTRRDAVTHQFVLAGNPERPRARTARGDHGVRSQVRAVGEFDLERPVRIVDAFDHAVADLRAEPFRLLFHVVDKFGAADPLGEARIVRDVGRQGELAAWLAAFEHEGLVVRARGVDRRRQSRDPRPRDDEPVVVRLRAFGHTPR
jgi:hypothetical protein